MPCTGDIKESQQAVSKCQLQTSGGRGGVHGRKKHSKFILINYLCDVKHMLIFIWCFFGCNSLVQPPDVSIITPENSTAADPEWWDFCAGQRLLFV